MSYKTEKVLKHIVTTLSPGDEFVYKDGEKLWINCGSCIRKGDPHYTYVVTLSNFKNHNCRCTKCKDRSRPGKRTKFSKIYDAFIAEGYKLHTKEEEYKDNKTKLITTCPNKHEYITCWTNFKDRKRRCDKCDDETKQERMRIACGLPLEEARARAAKARLTLVEENYLNVKDKILFRCNDNEKHEFVTTLDSIYSKGTGCPSCKTSAGEREVMTVLDELIESKKITSYEHEVRTQIQGHNYRYDFSAIVRGIEVFIEFDGEQHFNDKLEFVAGKNNFPFTRQSDKDKTLYCIRNKIPFLRISFYEEDNIKAHIFAFFKNVVNRKTGVYVSNINAYKFLVGIETEEISSYDVRATEYLASDMQIIAEL